MSNSVRLHRRQATRLPRPWHSPGKNIGVGCHFLLQCMKVKSESEVAQSCPTLSDPMDCRLPGSSIHGIFQARVLEWGAIAFSRYTVLLLTKYMFTLSKHTRELSGQFSSFPLLGSAWHSLKGSIFEILLMMIAIIHKNQTKFHFLKGWEEKQSWGSESWDSKPPLMNAS